MNRVVLAVCVVAACGDADVDRIGVAQNELGVTSLEVEHGVDATFELRAFDGSDTEVGFVRLRVGDVSGLPGSSDDALGSEMRIALREHETHLITRETQRYELSALEPALQAFVQLPEVSAELARANIIVPTVDVTSTTDEVGYAFTAGTCQTSELNVSPTAKQCCATYDWYYYNVYRTAATLFINPAGQAVSRSRRSWTTAVCQNQDGSSCSGTACYYGPNGYARPIVTSPPAGYPYAKVVRYNYPEPNELGGTDSTCTVAWYATPPTPGWGDVTGTVALGGGCCVNGTGACNLPGKPACSTCGGGGSAGAGAWDY